MQPHRMCMKEAYMKIQTCIVLIGEQLHKQSRSCSGKTHGEKNYDLYSVERRQFGLTAFSKRHEKLIAFPKKTEKTERK